MLDPSSRSPLTDLRSDLVWATERLLEGIPANAVRPDGRSRSLLLADAGLSPRHRILRSVEPVLQVRPQGNALIVPAAAMPIPKMRQVPVEVAKSRSQKPNILTVIAGSFLEEVPILGDFLDPHIKGTLQDQARDRLMAIARRAVALKELPSLGKVVERAGAQIAGALAVRQASKQILRVVLGSLTGPIGWAAMALSVIKTIGSRLFNWWR